MSNPKESSAPSESDYDSSSSLEIVVDRSKLKEALAKDREEEKKLAQEKGKPTYSDGSAVVFGSDGKPLSEKIARREKIIKKRKEMKAQVMKNIARHLQRAQVRIAYNFFTRDIPPAQNQLFPIKKKVTVTADEDRLCVKVVRRPQLYDSDY